MANAETIAYLQAIVGADTADFRREMSGIRKELYAIEKGPLKSLQTMGRNLTYSLTAPLTIMGGAATSEFAKFEANMRNVNAIAQLTEKELEEITQRTLDMGKAIRSGPTAAAEALYTVYSAGITETEAAFNTMEVATMTAEAGLANLTTTTEALASAMLAYSAEGMTAERASNALTRMVAIGVGEMEEFAGTVALATPTAAGLGVEIEDLYAHIAFLTQRGFSASRASTSLNAAMSSLIKPTEAMSAAFGKLGVTGGEELLEKFGSLDKAFVALIGTTDGTQEQINQLFNTIRGARAVNTFVNDIDALTLMLEEFNHGLDTATLDAWEQQMKSLSATFDKAKAALQAVAIVIGKDLAPIVSRVIRKLTEWMLAFTDLDKATRMVILGVAAFAAAIGPVIWTVSTLLGLVNPVTLAIAGLGLAFATNFAGARDIVMSFWNTVKGPLTDVRIAVDKIKDALFGLWEITQVTTGWDIVEVTPDNMMTFNFKPGESIWDKWIESGGSDFMDWTEFQSMFDGVGTIHPGELTIGGFGSNDSTRLFRAEEFVDTETVSAGIGRRLSHAIELAEMYLVPAIAKLWDKFKATLMAHLPWMSEAGGFMVGYLIAGIVQGTVNIVGRIVNMFASGDYSEMFMIGKDRIAGPFLEGLKEGLSSFELGGNFITFIENLPTKIDTAKTKLIELGTDIKNTASAWILFGLVALGPAAILVGPLLGSLLITKLTMVAWTLGMGTATAAVKLFGIVVAIATSPITWLAIAIGLVIAFLATRDGGLIGSLNTAATAARELAIIGLWVLAVSANWLRTKLGELWLTVVKLAAIGFYGLAVAGNWLRTKFDELKLTAIKLAVIGLYGLATAGEWLRGKFDGIRTSVENAIEKVIDFKQKIDNLVLSIAGFGISVGLWFIDRIEAAKTKWQELTDLFSVEGGLFGLGGIGGSVAEMFKNIFPTDDEGNIIFIKQIQDVKDAVVENFGIIWDTINDIATGENSIGSLLATAGDAFLEFRENAINVLSGLGQGLGDIFVESIETAINAMISAMENSINAVIDRLKGWLIGIANALPLGTGAPAARLAENFEPVHFDRVNLSSGSSSGGTQEGALHGPNGMRFGGIVNPGTWYQVNERGPEFFQPNVGGRIMPASMTAREQRKDGQTQIVTNVVHIHDATDVDAILYELNRRGIMLT
jgi:TP901 family phage tail tape measure protein